MATLEMQSTAQLAESRRKMQAKRRFKKPHCADAFHGDDGVRPVLADLDPDVHHHPWY